MTAVPSDVAATWSSGRAVPGVHFAHDDLVTILAGAHTGNVGSLVAIEQIEPDVVYRVEIDTDFVVPAKQSEIELTD